MSQTSSIVETLKLLLKSRGMTYRDIAQGLDLSEASIKRLFAEQNFSLQRLDQICQIIGIEISDLIKTMESQQYQLKELTVKQEEELVADTQLLLVVFVVLNGWAYEDILQWYELSESDTIRCLARLDRLKIIDLLPNNRIRLRVAANFSWRRNGPIQKFFTRNLQEDFLKSRFDKKEETLQFPSGLLSRASCDLFNRRIKQLIQEFHTLNEQDRSLPLSERVGYSLLLAFRPWRPYIFEKMRRKDI
ncbi:MAG: helix-turn-helix transcriptional regulator [Gammaproteobacteria bacterium]|nr:helix-turn-helix transcriptional regulator [Gammaproteobacteria bacterium]